jgi:transcription elongation factor Elf1
MSNVAIKIGKERLTPADSVEMGVVICDNCGARFTITQPAHHQNMDAAERQATWLERKLEHDHANGFEHDDAIDLPGFSRN